MWTIEATRTDTGHRVRFTGNFLWMCQGYYRHSEGYTPEWPGLAQFEGRIVHPQTWPEDLDYAGKTVVVIGSGATAATLIPAIAEDCGQVTMMSAASVFPDRGRMPASSKVSISSVTTPCRHGSPATDRRRGYRRCAAARAGNAA